MLLNWTRVDDKDLSASFEDFIFRLRADTKKVKNRWGENVPVPIKKVQVRKRQNTDFRDLGYEFLIKEVDFIDEEQRQFVDGVVWEDTVSIVERSEDILSGLEYIDKDNLDYDEADIPSSPIEILRAASQGIIKALQDRSYIKGPENKEALEDMFVRMLSFWENSHDISQYLNENGESLVTPIQEKEIEIEIKTLMVEPDMYCSGGWKEVWDYQKALHDEEWLEETLEEEREEEEYNRLSKNERKKIEGRGTGEGSEYKSWLTCEDVPDDYQESSSVWPGSMLVDRAVNLIGEIDQAFYKTLQWDDSIKEAKEYFPLELNETLEIAKRLSLDHPIDSETQQPEVLVANFFVTYASKGGVESQEVILTSWGEDLDSVHVRTNIKIQREYWSSRGIEVRIVTEDQINWTLKRNLEFIDTMKKASHYNISEEICAFVLKRLASSKRKDPGMLLYQFNNEAASLYTEGEIHPGDILKVVEFLLMNKIIHFDFENEEYSIEMKISEFVIRRKQFTIEKVQKPNKYFSDNIVTVLN
ncbi:TnsA endonuclease N-terminal domain-containing protein (plasmid) [Rossellomorea sp. AcN35-11]|nr:TnsA endonuclease N-terminal domain-containing protein [Rossellomorea aquimaris]WJV32036.1 TnsA endonuclease N-terminal domain-containing protein [Rossellomorea sp. AcN35-11]